MLCPNTLCLLWFREMQSIGKAKIVYTFDFHCFMDVAAILETEQVHCLVNL